MKVEDLALQLYRTIDEQADYHIHVVSPKYQIIDTIGTAHEQLDTQHWGTWAFADEDGRFIFNDVEAKTAYEMLNMVVEQFKGTLL